LISDFQMNILLLGKNGQLGWELQRSLSVLGRLTALDRSSTDYCGDLSNLEGLAQTVRELKPQVIVNAAAYTAVDKAESDRETAYRVNADAPSVLAQEAEKLGSVLMHYSTDYVFDGSGTEPWVESNGVAPVNVYGASKLAGEQAIQTQCERHFIFRTSWVYAAQGGNFAKTMLRLAKERDELTVIADQFGAPTGADLLADASAQVLARMQAYPSRQNFGLYHLAASGCTNWHEYASFVIESAHRLGIQTKVNADQIKPIPTSSYPTPAKRPLNSRLNTQGFRESFGLTLPDWRHGVLRLIHTWTQ
jgi:dTDP-4-dehydrorhamnose reductase